MHTKSIVVSFSLEDQAFHKESVLEYTQGNALRLLTHRRAHYHAIAVVETDEEADRVVKEFSRQQRVARGEEEPFVRERAMAAAAAV